MHPRIKHIVPSTPHCFSTNIFDTLAKCIFAFGDTPLYGSRFTCIRPRLRPPSPVSALLHFDTAPWFSGDTRIYVVLRRRIVTNEFISEILLFSGPPIMSLAATDIKIRCTMAICKTKKKSGLPLLVAHNENLIRCY